MWRDYILWCLFLSGLLVNRLGLDGLLGGLVGLLGWGLMGYSVGAVPLIGNYH
jgi:hypothetical protein